MLLNVDVIVIVDNDRTRKHFFVFQKKKNNGSQVPVPGQLLLDYGYLIQKYGPDVTEVTTQLEVGFEEVGGLIMSYRMWPAKLNTARTIIK